MRSENRALLITSIARARRWLSELVAEPTTNTETIATREGYSVRKVNMTISLAFLAPDLVKAAIEGRLPHGIGSCPPRRPARRMVSPAPDARTSAIRTESPLTTVSGCRATELPGPETKAPSRHSRHGLAVSETARSYKTPPRAGLCGHPQEFSANGELRGGGCSRDRTCLIIVDFPDNPQNTGYSAEYGSILEMRITNQAGLSMRYAVASLLELAGMFCKLAGNYQGSSGSGQAPDPRRGGGVAQTARRYGIACRALHQASRARRMSV